MSDDGRTWLQKNFHLVAAGGLVAFLGLMISLQYGDVLFGGGGGGGTSAGTAIRAGMGAPPEVQAPQPAQLPGQPAQPAYPAAQAGGSTGQFAPPYQVTQPGAFEQTIADTSANDLQAQQARAALEQARDPNRFGGGMSDVSVILDRLAAIETGLRDLQARMDRAEDGVAFLVGRNGGQVQGADDLLGRLGAIEQAVTGLTAETRQLAARGAPVQAAQVASPSQPAAPRFAVQAANQQSAWVADLAQNRAVQVSVGDTLPGIGRIERIVNIGGRWVIVGSDGTVE